MDVSTSLQNARTTLNKRGHATTCSHSFQFASTRLMAWAQWIEARALPPLPRHLIAVTKQLFQDKNMLRLAHPFMPCLSFASSNLMAWALWVEARGLPLLPRHLIAVTKQLFQDKNIIRLAHLFMPCHLFASTWLTIQMNVYNKYTWRL